MTHQILSHRIATAQASGRHLLAELLLEQERLLFGHRINRDEPRTAAPILHWSAE